ncbi:uncharacterized protein [Narcine bancroftii]|uniref:uncharacterized protein n=1 Tax=Narcine bancroftii TaxID=1343680 RepID=UPI003831A008
MYETCSRDSKNFTKGGNIVMGHGLTVLTTHSIVAFVSSTAFRMTLIRQTRLEKILNAPNVTFTHEGINMADNMGEGEPHCCKKKVLRDSKIRPVLQATPLREPDETLFTDGCCYRHPKDGLKAAYAVVRKTTEGFEEIITGTVRGKESAQLAELQGMIAALECAEGKEVNIYTDSAYVVGTIQVELSQWIRSGFLTAARTPIKHEKDGRKLAEALLKPRALAIIKCKGHDKTDTMVARGNQEVDTAAKRATGYDSQFIMMQADRMAHDLLPPCEVGVIIQEQAKASPQEMMVWKERGATKDQGLWRSMDGRPVLPSGLMKPLLEEAHGLTQCGKKQMIKYLIHWWHPFLLAMVENHIRECKVCITYNVKATVKPHKGQFPLPKLPGQEIVIDYTGMIERARGYRYLLVAVDVYTGWPEAIPAKREDAKTIIKFLINQYIPIHGNIMGHILRIKIYTK